MVEVANPWCSKLMRKTPAYYARTNYSPDITTRNQLGDTCSFLLGSEAIVPKPLTTSPAVEAERPFPACCGVNEPNLMSSKGLEFFYDESEVSITNCASQVCLVLH